MQVCVPVFLRYINVKTVSVLETKCFCHENTLFLVHKQSVSKAIIFWNTFGVDVGRLPLFACEGKKVMATSVVVVLRTSDLVEGTFAAK